MADAGESPFFHQIDDPQILKYRFVSLKTAGMDFHVYWVPMDIHQDGRMGLGAIGNNWDPVDTLSYVVFYEDLYGRMTIRHYNLKARGIDAYSPYNFNNSGPDELAVTYRHNDTVWLEILSMYGEMSYRKMIEVAHDLNGNGFWDGYAYFCGVYDFDGDGYVEILAGIDTGYDLYPRKLLCLDWKNDTILWEYNLAGIVAGTNLFVTETGESAQPHIVLGAGSKGNAAVARDMDDRHSYLIVLDEYGREKWKVETGEVFTATYPLPVDYDGDGRDEIFVSRFVDRPGIDSTEDAHPVCIYEIYDRDGNLIASPPAGDSSKVGQAALFDLENDGIMEIVCSHSANRVVIYDQHLQMLKSIQFYSSVYIWDCFDFLGTGENQFLIQTGDKKLTLTDLDFNPLAQIDDEAGFDFYYYYSSLDNQRKCGGKFLLVQHMGRNCAIYGLEPTPWHTIFSRKPILAFLAAFVPLSLIIAIIWLVLAKFRQKNRIISKQRDRLDDALQELKRMQEKLIAAEKHRQAKEIAGGVAHEIHNALAPAMNALDKLRALLESDSTGNCERVARLLDLTDRSVTRAKNMTQLVNHYSRLDLEKSDEQVNLAAVVGEIIDENRGLVAEMGADIEIEINKDIFLNIFKPHLYSLINNLFRNALDAVAESESRRISITAAKSPGGAKIEVADTGCGIDQPNLARIFDAFYSTKPNSGTGLGLAVAAKIVELYGGRINVESSLDNGTKFIIFLSSQ